MERRGYQHVTHIGTSRVSDDTCHVRQCGTCGEVEIRDKELERYDLRAAAIVLRDAKTPEGAAIRFARKALGLTQVECAALLECRSETLSRWETDHEPMLRTTALAIVALLNQAKDEGFGAKAEAERILSNQPRLSLHEFVVRKVRTGS